MSKIHKIGDFGCKNHQKFEENSKINNYFLVPQIDIPVALCGRLGLAIFYELKMFALCSFT